MQGFHKWVFILGLAAAGYARAADGGAAGHYTGTVVDDQGQPVAGASVECYQDASPVAAYTAQDFALKERGTTDSKGGFTVSAGEGVTIVVVKKEGLAPGWRTFASVLGDSSDPVVLTALATPARSEVDTNGQLITNAAPAPYALAGRVVDENDQPVADAEVWVALAMPVPKSSASPPVVVPGADPLAALFMPLPTGGGFSQSSMIFGKLARDCFSARTASDGRFRIANFPGNTQAALAVHKTGMALPFRADFGGGFGFRLRVNVRALIGAPPPYFSGLQQSMADAAALREIMPYTSGQLEIKLTLAPAGNIEGKVTAQETGQPLPGVKLLWLSPGRGLSGIEMPETVLSGADGSFRMADILPGRAAIAAAFSGEPVADWTAQNVSVTVAAGETTKDVQVRAVKGEMAAITVVQRKGRQPLANVSVCASGVLSPATALSGADGVARLRLLPGRWNVSASREGWNDGQTAVTVATGQTNQALVLLDPRSRITGTVRDPSGAPVAGAIISLNPGAGNNYATVKTDANGRYEESWQVFARGNQQKFTLLARSVERNLAVNHAIDDTTTNLDLNLQPGVTLIAKVQDSTGKTVTNAIGSVAWRNGDASGALGVPCQSDAQGRIEIADMPPEEGYSISVSANGYGQGVQKVQSLVPQTGRLEFPTVVLPLGNLKLAGHVLGADGKPVAGADVEMGVIGQRYVSTNTDGTGHFAFDTATEGPLWVSANSPGDDGPYRNIRNRSITAQGGDTNVVIQYVANGQEEGAPEVTTSGRVLDPAGAPVSGARISVLPVNGTGIEVRSDADGKYTVIWSKHKVWRILENPFIYARDPERHLTVGQAIDGMTTNLDLRLETGLTLSVKVQDANGQPIPTATGYLSASAGGLGFLLTQPEAKANDQGVIEIKDMLQGWSYGGSITAPGYGTARILAQAEQTKTNHFEFPAVVFKPADRKVAGQVLGPDSKPIAGVNVYLSGEGQPNGRATTDDTGHFVLNTVGDGTVRLHASIQSPGGDFEGSDIQAQSGGTNVVIRFARSAVNDFGAVWTSGTVVDSSGKPAAGVVVKVWQGTRNTNEVKTDSDGRYSIHWQKQQYLGDAWTPLLFARDLERNLAASEAIDDTVTNQDLTLQPGLTLSVKVQDVNGKPVPTATADLSLWSGLTEFKFNPIPYRPNDQGVIEITALPQGRHYSMAITAKGYHTASFQARAAETETNRLDFPTTVLKIPNRRLAGQVLDTEGKPLPGAVVRIQGEGQP